MEITLLCAEQLTLHYCPMTDFPLFLCSVRVQAFGQTIIHHLGTVAFGALLVAIIRTIRAVVSYFQRKLKKQHNKVAEYLLCCVQCCLGCLERGGNQYIRPHGGGIRYHERAGGGDKRTG